MQLQNHEKRHFNPDPSDLLQGHIPSRHKNSGHWSKGVIMVDHIYPILSALHIDLAPLCPVISRNQYPFQRVFRCQISSPWMSENLNVLLGAKISSEKYTETKETDTVPMRRITARKFLAKDLGFFAFPRRLNRRIITRNAIFFLSKATGSSSLGYSSISRKISNGTKSMVARKRRTGKKA